MTPLAALLKKHAPAHFTDVRCIENAATIHRDTQEMEKISILDRDKIHVWHRKQLFNQINWLLGMYGLEMAEDTLNIHPLYEEKVLVCLK